MSRDHGVTVRQQQPTVYLVTRQREGNLAPDVVNPVAVGVVGNKHTTSAVVKIVVRAELGHVVGTVDAQTDNENLDSRLPGKVPVLRARGRSHACAQVHYL